METITFYSYKGGVGRTLALANTAVYLSRFEQNVCIIDFDLEAPGMHYKLPLFFSSSIERGLVDYIYEFTSSDNIPESLGKYCLKAKNIPKNQGDIRLIPAGNVLSAEYWQKLASIDWHDLFYKEGGEGIPFFLELKEKIRREIKPDFLLIDSRTGITEMSGVCTSVLPDKVVFLITNNRENIEGSRQILRGIQKTKRLKGQKPIVVNFALTRIPNPTNDEDKINEGKIIKEIKEFLNEETENLDKQLNVSEISVLHSDRELELSESLRLSHENIKDMPLTKDYLKLFLKNIPKNIIKSKIDSVVESISTARKLPGGSDKFQKELEALIQIYPHPKYFERLIESDSFRFIDTDKKLSIFGDLWKVSKEFSDKMNSEFIRLFERKYYGNINENHLEIVEEYLKSESENKWKVELKLADLYNEKGIYKKALKHYYSLVDKAKDREKILEKIFNIYIEIDDFEEALKLYANYNEFIVNTPSLKIKSLEIMYKAGKIGGIRKLLSGGCCVENLLLEQAPDLFFDIMKMLGKTDEINAKLEMMLKKTIKDGSSADLRKLGKIFYRLDRRDEFEKKIPERFPGKKAILYDLDKEYAFISKDSSKLI